MRLSHWLWLSGLATATTVSITHPEAAFPATINAGLISFGIGYLLGATSGGQVVETITKPVTPRTIPNLSDMVMPIGEGWNVMQVKTAKVEQRDPRLKQWAYAVAYNGTSMKQSKWAGRKRQFSRPEYERWIACLLESGIVTFVNPSDPSRGYKPNGAYGWSKIKDMADGRYYLPLPTAILSNEQMRYVSARMRERVSVGEGQ